MYCSREYQLTSRQLQRDQNMAAKIVLNKGKYYSPARCLEELHWLLIQQRITFKNTNISLQMHSWKAHSYLEKLITIKQSRREGMRSEKQTRILEVQHTSKKTFAARSFSVKGPGYWNSLPEEIRRIEDYNKFKGNLKTHVYQIAFLT